MSTFDLSSVDRYYEIQEEAYMESDVEGMNSQQIDLGHQQLALLTQLLQMSRNMRHIDEMFLWLSHNLGQRLNIDVLQFWSYQAHTNGQYTAELRVTANQNTLFPLQVVNNAEVVEKVREMFTHLSGASPQPVKNLFSLSQAEVLMRYNLHNWACLFLRSEAVLPPPMNHDLPDGAVPTPLTMIISLFTQQAPDPNLLPTINQILEHALSIAKNRGLLPSETKLILGNVTNTRGQSQQFILNDLIPQWKQDVEAMQVNNPLANATPITDKRARQLYFAIDGKRNIAQLAESIRFDQSEMNSAVQLLLKQKLIQLYEPSGKALDSSLFIE